MTNFLYAEINVVGILLLLLFLNNMNRNRYKNASTDQMLFNACMVMNILIFLFDTGMWLFDGNPGAVSRSLNMIVTMLYYISNPFICFVWLLYTDFKIYESRSGLMKRARFYIIPSAAIVLLTLLTPFTGWLFVVDETNTYSRGPFFWIMALAALFYLVWACAISIRDFVQNGWEENKSINIHLIVFPMLILTASVIQILFFGISIIWICAMLAFASIYVNIQNGEISTDPLTGLSNRRRLDEHLQRKIKMRRKEQLLFAIMLDLDDFKWINDHCGHAVGDQALGKMGELLRQLCRGGDDFVARIGGDEFVLIGERAETSEIRQLMDDITSRVRAYNEQRQADYALLPSMGFAVCQNDDTPDSLLAAADQAMYRDKQRRKSAHEDESVK